MNAEPVCSLCCRRGGGSGGGAPVNSMGCTGACLRWAVQNIKNPPFFEDVVRWKAWLVTPGTVASFRAICSDLNDLGRGYLQWTLVIPHEESGEMSAACYCGGSVSSCDLASECQLMQTTTGQQKLGFLKNGGKNNYVGPSPFEPSTKVLKRETPL